MRWQGKAKQVACQTSAGWICCRCLHVLWQTRSPALLRCKRLLCRGPSWRGGRRFSGSVPGASSLVEFGNWPLHFKPDSVAGWFSDSKRRTFSCFVFTLYPHGHAVHLHPTLTSLTSDSRQKRQRQLETVELFLQLCKTFCGVGLRLTTLLLHNRPEFTGNYR